MQAQSGRSNYIAEFAKRFLLGGVVQVEAQVQAAIRQLFD